MLRKPFQKLIYQLALHFDDVHKTAITTPFGLFEYNAFWTTESTFHQMMDNIYEFSCIFMYINDILIFSDIEETHSKKLNQVLPKLNEHNVKIYFSKCLLEAHRLEVWRFSISSKGVEHS